MDKYNDKVSNEIPCCRNTFYVKYGKRMIDLLLSIIAIIILSPVLLVVIIMELIFHGIPVFYKTQRPGKNGELFTIRKFRSMTNERDENGNLLPGNKRVTKFGRFLRRTSIDELPELFSVLLGDMSIVGPRPLLPEYMTRYSKRHMCRHQVKPGLTCARIKHYKGEEIPNTWTWNDQFENDIWYIEHISLWVDIKMFFAIIKTVIVGGDYRTNDERAEFVGSDLDE